MFFPIGTDRRLKHTPWVNTALVLANILISVWIWSRYGSPSVDNPAGAYMLLPWEPRLGQFFTYQFLHADWDHLLLNMLFLWVFGQSLEDRLGPIGYLAFYLAGGVMAGVGYAAFRDHPVLGASGAIAAVTGAYLALFPLSRVTLAFFFVYFFEVSSIFVIGLSVATDLFYQLTGSGGVAYLAHLSGYAYGFTVGMVLLWVRILPREPYDFLALIDRWQRRRQMRSVSRAGGGPWLSGAGQKVAQGKLTEADERIMQMRDAIGQAMAAGDRDRAVDTYERLLSIDADQILSREAQLEIANHAMAQQRHGTAARAYELYLKRFEREANVAEIQLLLALLYARYLDQPAEARRLLTRAAEALVEGPRRKMARELLNELSVE